MERNSFRSKVISMAKGEKMTVSIDTIAYDTIRNYACNLGFELNRKYSTKRNREERTYIITREA